MLESISCQRTDQLRTNNAVIRDTQHTPSNAEVQVNIYQTLKIQLTHNHLPSKSTIKTHQLLVITRPTTQQPQPPGIALHQGYKPLRLPAIDHHKINKL